MLILFEGPEGAGKTTIAKRLTAYLTKRGKSALYLREPGTRPGERSVGEAIRSVLLDKANKEMTALTEFFLFQASRAQFVQRILYPALSANDTVVLDRYSLSTMAYQIAGRHLPIGPCLAAIDLATGGLVPDRTILLMASYETGKARQAGKALDRLESEAEEFHRRVITGYRSFAVTLDWRVSTIETDTLTPEEVFHQVTQILGA